MELLHNILRQSKEEKKIIAIYLNGEEIDFWCGYVQDYTDEYVVMAHYTKFGHYDGVLIEKLSAIGQISFDNDYCDAMAFLIKNNHLLYQQNEIVTEILVRDNWQYELLEQQLNNGDRMVRIALDSDTQHCGLVKWLDEDNVILDVYNGDGISDGTSVFRISDITMMRINDLDCRRRLLLCKWRNEKRR